MFLHFLVGHLFLFNNCLKKIEITSIGESCSLETCFKAVAYIKPGAWPAKILGKSRARFRERKAPFSFVFNDRFQEESHVGPPVYTIVRNVRG